MSRASRIEEQRAEILRMIARLQEGHRSPNGESRALHRAERGSSSATSALAGIDRRLARIEERVCCETDRKALPAAAELFGGVIQGEMLADMLQLVSVNAMSGVLEVKNGAGSIELFCKDGRILHAAGLGLAGESAVHAVFEIEEGSYSFRQTAQLPAERTITQGTQVLILEALRRRDARDAE